MLTRLRLLFLTDLGTIRRFVSRLVLRGDEHLLDLECGVDTPDILGVEIPDFLGVESPDLLGDLSIEQNEESTVRKFSPRRNLSSLAMLAS